MRFLTDRRLRLAFLLFVIAGAEAVGSGGVFGTVAVFSEVIAVIAMTWTLLAMIRDKKRQAGVDIGGTVYKVVMRLLGPVFTRIRRKNERRTHYIKGTDKVEFLSGGTRERISKRRSRKKRINLDNESENGGKIRLMYVKYVLRSAERGIGITYANTPAEIRELDGKDGTDELFDVYSRVRYGKTGSADNAEVERCRRIADEA